MRRQISYQSIYDSGSFLKRIAVSGVDKRYHNTLAQAHAILNTGFAYSSSLYISYDEFAYNLRLLLSHRVSTDGLLVDYNFPPGYYKNKIALYDQSRLLQMVATIGAFVRPDHVLSISMHDKSSDIGLSIRHPDLQSAQFDLSLLSRFYSDQLSISYQSDIIQISYIPQ